MDHSVQAKVDGDVTTRARVVVFTVELFNKNGGKVPSDYWALPNKNINLKLKSLLFSRFYGNNATKYAMENKPLTIKTFEKLKNITLIKSGFIVNIHCPWLGYSLLGHFTCDDQIYLIEIMCPSKRIGKIEEMGGLLRFELPALTSLGAIEHTE
ncbi:Exonuclease, phage-type/RecB, C-terminal [Cinara cedri]|uniref:Exonuclease, phage-type/RecB, C-terminal n=1 Tax=Cinara cedri TaxID=506608 RepID=A0A5E4M999_9HEMI|nr:Exonuclease, phage-type/RecB, C-terminal [Cinara cedri]